MMSKYKGIRYTGSSLCTKSDGFIQILCVVLCYRVCVEGRRFVLGRKKVLKRN